MKTLDTPFLKKLRCICDMSTSCAALTLINIGEIRYMFNRKTLFRRNKTTNSSGKSIPIDPVKSKWLDRFSEPQTGHAIDAEQAYNQSMEEAKVFSENGLFQKNDVFLDLGSGNGRQAIGLLEYGIKKYVGIEPVKESVEFSRRTFSDYLQCEFIWLNLKNDQYNPTGTINPLEMRIPFEDGYFDAAIAGSLFTHLGSLDVCEHYLGEIHRALKTGGRLFCTWFRNPPNALSDDHKRSVFKEADIITMSTKYFTVYHTYGGMSDQFHDQWCLYCRK